MAEIRLANGPTCYVDDEDLPLVAGCRWYARADLHTSYVVGRKDGVSVRMHRLIVNAPHGFHVDHVDGDGLNNRRANLRVVTCSENLRNQVHRTPTASGYVGVTFYQVGNYRRWKAGVGRDGECIHIGYYRSPEEAARAREGWLAEETSRNGNRPELDRNQRAWPSPGERNGRAQIDEETAMAIRRTRQTTDLSDREIGLIFGVSRYVVNKIGNGKTWRHQLVASEPA